MKFKHIIPLKVLFEMLRKNENVNLDIAVATPAWGHPMPMFREMEEGFDLCLRTFHDPVVLRPSGFKIKQKVAQFSDGSEARRAQGCLSRKPSASIHLS